MRSYYKNDPYQTRARFASTCPDCNARIRKGDDITVWPSRGRAEILDEWAEHIRWYGLMENTRAVVDRYLESRSQEGYHVQRV